MQKKFKQWDWNQYSGSQYTKEFLMTVQGTKISIEAFTLGYSSLPYNGGGNRSDHRSPSASRTKYKYLDKNYNFFGNHPQ